MDIVRWDPFGELDSIHDELNRLFRRSFGAIEPSRRTVANGWMPALDLFETDDKVELTDRLFEPLERLLGEKAWKIESAS